MRIPISSLIRPAFAAMLVSSTAAIVLARLAPAGTGWRIPSATRYASVNTFYLDHCRRGSFWVDREGGPALDLRAPDDELLEYASCSPWRDERGRTQVVSRWSQNLRSESSGTAYGLARLSFPDGEVLDHFETDVVPASTPCWYPGTRARVLFAGGDGILYLYDFESTDSGDGPDDAPGRRLRAIPWNCAVPGGDGVYLSEPNWPSDPRFSHLLFVGLRKIGRTKSHLPPAMTQIWWLRLGDDGASIDAAGPLIDLPTGGPDTYDRCATFAVTADGRPMLAYYRRQGQHSTGLYIVPLELDPASRSPRPPSGEATKVADGCLTCPPIFSCDGRWVSIIQGGWGYQGAVRRIPLAFGGDGIADSRSCSVGEPGPAVR
jgi:hypothetical protein